MKQCKRIFLNCTVSYCVSQKKGYPLKSSARAACSNFNALTRAVCGTRFGILFYQIWLDALRQHPLLYIIATFTTGGASPTRSKQLW